MSLIGTLMALLVLSGVKRLKKSKLIRSNQNQQEETENLDIQEWSEEN
jgi:hypothetical protein